MRECVWIACLQIDVKLRLTGREVIPKPGGYTTYFSTHVRKAAPAGDGGMCVPIIFPAESSVKQAAAA